MGHQPPEIVRCRYVIVNEIQALEHLGCDDEPVGHLNPQTLECYEIQPLVAQVNDIVAEHLPGINGADRCLWVVVEKG